MYKPLSPLKETEAQNMAQTGAVYTHQSMMETERMLYNAQESFIMRVKSESKFLQHTQMWKFKLRKRTEYETLPNSEQ
jgi:hypothetical protein